MSISANSKCNPNTHKNRGALTNKGAVFILVDGGIAWCDTALATKQSPGLFLPNANAFGASCLLHCVQFTHRTLQNTHLYKCRGRCPHRPVVGRQIAAPTVLWGPQKGKSLFGERRHYGMRAGWILLEIRHMQYGVNVDEVGADIIRPLNSPQLSVSFQTPSTAPTARERRSPPKSHGAYCRRTPG